MDWEYSEPFDIEEWIGFVYEIERIDTGRKYIGQKLFWKPKYSVRTNKKTGKKVRKRLRTESDWKDYWSSSEHLKTDVELVGKENFRRRIIKLCKTKGRLNYEELREQVNRGVLESDLWYNGIIQVRIHKRHVIGTIETIEDDNE